MKDRLAFALFASIWPTVAHASDMGLMIPYMFMWVTWLGALVALSLLFTDWAGSFRLLANIAYWLCVVLVGIPGVLCTWVALGYVFEGRYVDDAWTVVLSYVVFLVLMSFVTSSRRRFRGSRAA